MSQGISSETPSYSVAPTDPQAGASKPETRRVIQLDILRGLAILLVLGRHGVLDPGQAGVLRIPATMLNRFGWTGVDMFFVLSGFLVGGLLMRELKVYGKIDVKRFLIRRGMKIWPVYYLFLCVAVTLLVVTDKAHFPVPTWQLVIQYILSLQNYNVFHLPYGNPLFAGQTWSLAVEEHFYLALPPLLLFLAKDRRRLAWIPAIAVALDLICLGLRFRVPPPFQPFAHQLPTHLRIDSLFTGVVLAYWYHFRPEVMDRLKQLRLPLTVVGLLLLAPMVRLPLDEKRFVWTFGYTMLSLGYACLLTVFVTTSAGEGLLGRWFQSKTAKVLAYIGGFSYSIYIWHIDLIIIPMQRWINTGVLSGLPATLRWLVLMSAGVLVSIGAGILLAKLTERPSLILRDRLFPARTDALGPISTANAAPLDSEERRV